MKPLLLLAMISCLAGCTASPDNNNPPQPKISVVQAPAPAPVAHAPAPKKTLTAFRSEQEIVGYLHELAEKQRLAPKRKAEGYSYNAATPAPATAQASAADAKGASSNAESVTNVQHAGVDEGGIVKVHGNHLVVLRRGRLFTVSIADGALTPISSIDAFGPDIDPGGTWYDEMLVSDDTVAVIGYSYQRGGTEVGLFQIDPAGKLSYRSTYHLRSNDYYSSRNYASRLIGTKLIFYAPMYIYPGTPDPFQNFPAVRKWHKGAAPSEFHRIAAATDVYRAPYPLNPAYGMALHTVTVCDVARGGFDCKATSVLGPGGRVFYVSPESVYVWMSEWGQRGPESKPQGLLYRLPLDGSAPTALGVSGSPVDQFSFLESEDGHLNVLVRSDAAGDGMWAPEVAAGDVALMRVPLSSFSDGSAGVPAANYRRLPHADGYSYTFQNRFVGDYLLYGNGSGWGSPQNKKYSNLYAVRWAKGSAQAIPLAHGVDRIEQMGLDAVVVGTDGKDLHFSAVRLGNVAEVVDEYIRKDASQGELRSQGFFYKPDARDSGMLGLPVSLPGRPGYEHLFQNSSAILFLKNNMLHFEEAGELVAQPEHARDDGCRASCVDWYGNSRPLFLRGRIIALLGYELVEGTLKNGQMHELRRVSYAPQSMTAQR